MYPACSLEARSRNASWDRSSRGWAFSADACFAPTRSASESWSTRTGCIAGPVLSPTTSGYASAPSTTPGGDVFVRGGAASELGSVSGIVRSGGRRSITAWAVSRAALAERRSAAPSEEPVTSTTPAVRRNAARIARPVSPKSGPRISSRTLPIAPPFSPPRATISPSSSSAVPVRNGRRSTSSARATISPPRAPSRSGSTSPASPTSQSVPCATF